MQIKHFDHVNVRTSQLERMVMWYSDILGMSAGDRPAFPFPGAWMYAGGIVMVHLVGVEDKTAIGSEMSLKLEHFAFRAAGAAEFEDRLNSRDVPYRRIDIAEIGTVAFNVWDPDGNHIHVDFALNE